MLIGHKYTEERVGLELRFQVWERVSGRCEYCLIHEEDSSFSHEVDHVVSRQHGGATESGNLALACFLCNRCKGTNLTSLDLAGTVVRLFNPRRDRWKVHFRLEGSVIEPLTPEAAATARLLRFNIAERVIERNMLRRLDRYPR